MLPHLKRPVESPGLPDAALRREIELREAAEVRPYSQSAGHMQPCMAVAWHAPAAAAAVLRMHAVTGTPELLPQPSWCYLSMHP